MSTTMTLGYDINDKRATTMLQLLLASGLFIEQTPKCGMEEAAEDIREGRVYKMTSNEEFFSQL